MFTADVLIRARQDEFLREGSRQRLITQARRARGGRFARFVHGRRAQRSLAAMRNASPGQGPRGRRALLEQVTIFRGLPRRDLALLARLADPISLPAGSLLADEHRPTPQFVALTSGVAECRFAGTRIGVVQQGDHFGQLTMVLSDPESATVRALTDVDGFVLGRREFWAILHRSPALSMRLTTSLAEQLRRIQRDLARVDRSRTVTLEPSAEPIAVTA